MLPIILININKKVIRTKLMEKYNGFHSQKILITKIPFICTNILNISISYCFRYVYHQPFAAAPALIALTLCKYANLGKCYLLLL